MAATWISPENVQAATGLSVNALIGVAIGIASIGLAVFFVVYRCPSCGQPIWARDTSPDSTGMFFQLNPKQCPQCGVSFT
jgi:predicted RNA-binding Zn-ribbon protein involved in translation (DUF1610 family)